MTGVVDLPTMRCRECETVGEMFLWSTTPHSQRERPLRWPIECRKCGQMALSSHRDVRHAALRAMAAR